MTPALVWFRQDLRLRDNPALSAAIRRAGPVVPVFVLDPEGEGRWAPGARSRWWLHHSLEALGDSLCERGSRLVLARGDSQRELLRLARLTGAGAVYWNRRYEPAAVRRDRAIMASLSGRGLDARSFNSALLFEPHAVANRQGGPFQVFGPFWRHCLSLPVEPPVRLASATLVAPRAWPKSLEAADFGLIAGSPWDPGLAGTWRPGEAAAAARLRRFVQDSLERYAESRDNPGEAATAVLSAHLHFGETGPRQVWSAVRALSRDTGVFPVGNGARVFLGEIGWREFAHHLLYHFPTSPGSPLRPAYRRFPWVRDPGRGLLAAWCAGQTGYPIVDAGMRQLQRTGWMHNRVRMIAASFLVKHLRIPWTKGAAWFWNTLVDADLANNTLGWQWSAGCGADAAPFFRIFSPVRQGLRFDTSGDYVRRWVPELAAMPSEHIHSPSEAPAGVLAAAGVRLGVSYPRPIVDHATARAAALSAYEEMRTALDA